MNSFIGAAPLVFGLPVDTRTMAEVCHLGTITLAEEEAASSSNTRLKTTQLIHLEPFINEG